VGFAVANNQAFREARGEFIMPLNPDTEASPACLETLVGFLRDHPRAGLAVPVNLEASGASKAPLHTFGLVDWPVAIKVARRRWGRSQNDVLDGPTRVEWMWTTGFVCRRAALGPQLFSEEMFLFGEEYQVCRDVRGRGYEIWILPDAKLLHHASVTWNRSDEKLAVARRLGMAALWNIRQHEFGPALATVSQALLGFESALIWGGLWLEKLVRRRARISLTDYKAQALASLALVLKGQDYVREINTTARRYFNGGRDPEPLDGSRGR
jgi:GT2 family glycosyltransferase